MANFEVVSTITDKDRITYDALAEDFAFQVDRYRDWLTIARWHLPAEYSYEDFLQAVEQMFTEAEANGYSKQGLHRYQLSSAKLANDVEGELTRPFAPGDFEEFGVRDEDIEFVGLGDDLANAYYCDTRMTEVLFEDRPHQRRGAFAIMANLFPSRLRLEPAEIGGFVLGLKRPD